MRLHEGRQIFHRFCRLSTKYDEKDAEKKYSQCLQKNDGRVRIGVIVYLCRTRGMGMEAVCQCLIESQRKLKTERYSVTALQGGVNVTVSEDDNTEADAVELTCDTDPETPLPTFGKLRLLYPLDLIYERGQTPPQCDSMLLTALTVMGAAMNWHVRTKYSDFFQYPCLQLFVMTPSASGKGAMARVRQLADPLHEHRLQKLPEAEAAYEADMIKYREKLKDLKEDEKAPTKPRRPVRELFLIPGNNTGTGILQNIIDSEGNGLFSRHIFYYMPHVDSTVIRQAINAVHIMSIVAVLREFEKHDGERLAKAYAMGRDTSSQECNLYYMSISDDDFLDVLTIFEALYQHSIHVLSFLKSTETERRVLSGWMLVLNEMPDEFTREEWNEECEKRMINKNTVRSWIARLLKKGIVTLDEEIGKYTKTVKKGKALQCNAATPATPYGEKEEKCYNVTL